MIHPSALRKQSAIYSELSVHFHQTSRRHVPEGSSLIYHQVFHLLLLPLKFLLLIFALESFLTSFFSEKTFWPFNSQHPPALNCP